MNFDALTPPHPFIALNFDFGGELVIIGDLKKFKMADGGHFEFPAVAKIAHAGPTAIFVW